MTRLRMKNQTRRVNAGFGEHQARVETSLIKITCFKTTLNITRSPPHLINEMNVATDIVHNYPADKEKITAPISMRRPDQTEKVEGILRYKTAKVKNDETPSAGTWNERRRGDEWEV